VGKTYAMLQAAQERRREGVDVVVGVVETHGRPETEALLAGLEVIPRATVAYHGQTLQEMDLDAILARRPALVLVDELAHTNAPGSRHAKRFADVQELLDAGIDVYTTINIQHLESLNDVVAQITGVRVRETIPDSVLDRADEVKLIDLSPEELIQRLRDGKVYVPQQAERALRNYFQPGNLTALRELALRETAEHVDDQMQAYMRAHAVAGPWAVSDRIMVAVSESPLAERLVRAARRMADRRAAPWLAVFVETPRFRHRPEAERERVARVLRLAEQLGGEAASIPGQHVAEELVRYARERNVTELILGKPLRPPWRELWRRSPVERVIRLAGGIDVRVIAADAETTGPPAASVSVERPGRLRGYAVAAMTVGAAAGFAWALMVRIPLLDPGMIFLAAVMVSAVAGARRAPRRSTPSHVRSPPRAARRICCVSSSRTSGASSAPRSCSCFPTSAGSAAAPSTRPAPSWRRPSAPPPPGPSSTRSRQGVARRRSPAVIGSTCRSARRAAPSACWRSTSGAPARRSP
jgi:two-component system, OmpR family, sensor histidine kinase KdpD